MDALTLSREDVRRLLSMADCIDAVERILIEHAAGNTIPPGILGAHVEHGGFHVKTAGSATRFVAKVNANFPRNPEAFGLPTIQGVVALFDCETGRVLAVMDSIEITSQRTAAASAVAAKYLAREDPRLVSIVGCGEQGRSHVRAMRFLWPLIPILAYDASHERALAFQRAMQEEGGGDVHVAESVHASREADVVVTCTTSTQPLLFVDDVSAGTFVAAVGADNPHKWEIGPALMATSRVVVDSLEQAATIGDLHHAIEAGLVTRGDVVAELSDVVGGRIVVRRAIDDIVVFDSTGTALQDVAAASLVYDRAS